MPAKSAWKERLPRTLANASDHGAWRPGARSPCGSEVHAMRAKAAVVAASPAKSQKKEPAARKPAHAGHREIQQHQIDVAQSIEDSRHVIERTRLSNLSAGVGASQSSPQRAAK